MSKCVNRVFLLGNVGRSPETRTTAAGDQVTGFTLATNESWTDKQGNREEKTQWHRLKCFGKVAGIVEQFVRKGARVYIEGSMDYGSYERDGEEVPTAEVIVRELVLLSPKGEPTPAPDDPPEQPLGAYDRPF